MKLETYGKQNIIKRKYHKLRNRFRITALEKKYSQYQTYVPRVNKMRMTIGVIGALIFIALPLVTPAAFPCIEWGLK